MRAAIFETIIEKIIPLGDELRHFTLRFKPTDHWEHEAGQFVNIIADDAPPLEGGKILKRAYSIASWPSQPGTLELFWKKVDGGPMTSGYLLNKKEGDKLKIQGPLGHFTVKQPLPKTIYFVSTGTGFAPFRAMIYDLLEKKADVNLVNIYGNRYEDQVFYKDDLEKLAATNPRLKNVMTVSRPKTWKGETRYVQMVLEGLLKPGDSAQVYICGLTDMILAVEKVAQAAGLKTKEHIFYEKYD